MTTQEMHIELNLELQKVNSQVSKNLQPEEMDWFLNNEVIKYLKSKVTSTSNLKKVGFQDTAKRVEDVKDLIRVSSRPIKVNSRGKQYISLPSDYFNYIRFDSYARKDCPNNTSSPVSTKQYKVAIPIKLDKERLTDYTITLTTATATTVLFALSDLPTGYLSTTQGNKQTFMLIKALKILLPNKIKEVLSPLSEIYWELESYSYTSLTFTIVSDVEILSSSTTYNTVVTDNSVVNEDISVTPLIDTPLKAKLRVIDEEFLTDVENSHLSKSRVNSPISSVIEGCLELSKCKGAIFGTVDIVYICKPNLIDIALNINLNVSDYVAKEIVSNTVRFLKAIIDDKSYQSYVQENVLIE